MSSIASADFQISRAGVVKARTLRTTAELESIASEWLELWRSLPNSTPFQSPQWLLPWWRTFGSDSLLTLEIRLSGVLMALAPLYIYADGSVRRLLFLGTGNSDYLDLLISPALDRNEFNHHLNEFLFEHDSLWDVADFQQIQEHSLTAFMNTPDEFERSIFVQSYCPLLKLDRISKYAMKKLEYYERRLSCQGNLGIQLVSAKEHLNDALSRFFDLHSAQWQAKGLRGVLDNERVRNFHRLVATNLNETGHLRFYELKVNGISIAYVYGFQHARRFYSYLGGVDPDWTRFSVGSQLIGHAIRESLREDCAAFDFLRGREAYKYFWGAEDTMNYRCEIRRRV
ncbi:MAG: glycosyl transferase [Bacteriovoracaceae bacterium]|nr:glycosyl transferase [Bacteriovoracaceae bacterium]